MGEASKLVQIRSGKDDCCEGRIAAGCSIAQSTTPCGIAR